MAKDLYTTSVAITGGRDGSARSEDAELDVRLALPAAIGGTGNGTNPEQLFAAGFGACFTSSLTHSAKGLGLRPDSIEVMATVTLTVDDTGAFGIRPELAVRLPGLSGPDAERLIVEARRICAYSNALGHVILAKVTRV
jgi:lipoyl-dependent peroxiredoxin